MNTGEDDRDQRMQDAFDMHPEINQGPGRITPQSNYSSAVSENDFGNSDGVKVFTLQGMKKRDTEAKKIMAEEEIG